MIKQAQEMQKKMKELDLAYTAFFEFAQLRGLNIKVLNISGCKVNEIHENRCATIKSFGVETVIYDSRFLSEPEIMWLKENFLTEDEAPK